MNTEEINFFGRNLLLYSTKRSLLSIILEIFFRFLFSSFLTLLLEDTSFLETVLIAIAHCFPLACPFSRALQRENIKPITSTPPNVIGMQVGIQKSSGVHCFPTSNSGVGKRESEREKIERETEKEKKRENREE